MAEVLGSLQQAMKFYEEALRFDVFCAEAYEKLIKKHMYTPEEGQCLRSGLSRSELRGLEQRLVERMIIEKQCDPDTATVVRCLYEQEVHQVRTEGTARSFSSVTRRAVGPTAGLRMERRL